jgi:uncharacterized repeat protein (TIGR03803 family)
VLDPGGELYGTTEYGGLTACTQGCGTVFKLTPPSPGGGRWTETVLYEFLGGSDGSIPASGVTIGPNGVLYGTTYFGGTASLGTVFQLSPPSSPGGAWTKTILTSFGGSSPLSLPSASVTLGPNGVLYGTTAGAGGAYQLTPPSEEGGAWTQTVIFTFESQNGGASVAPLTLGRSGALFGTSEAANS